MSLYSIESEKVLGMSHTGEVTVDGESAVELSDDEVDILVRLIRENGTTDVEELDLENLYPSIFYKLDSAYHDMESHAEEMHWLWEGYESHYFDYDEDELIAYCKKNLGFTFEFKPEEHLDAYDLEEYQEDPEAFEDTISDLESEAFAEWLDDYVHSLSDDQLCSFFYEHMNCDLSMDPVSYTVEIPPAIIKMAEG
jgi:hypothetical protein